MGAGHDHGTSEIQHERPLWWALGLTATFLVAEVIGGLVTNSLALLSDAAHMMTDVIALGVSLFAVRLSRRPADSRSTSGDDGNSIGEHDFRREVVLVKKLL